MIEFLGRLCIVRSADLRFRVSGILRKHNNLFIVDINGEACVAFSDDDVEWAVPSPDDFVRIRLKAGLVP